MVQVSFAVPKSLGTFIGEISPHAAGDEMRRLAAIGTARLEAIVRADGDIDLFFEVPVVVTKQQAEASVRIRKPALEDSGDALSRVMTRFERQLLSENLMEQPQETRPQER